MNKRVYLLSDEKLLAKALDALSHPCSIDHLAANFSYHVMLNFSDTLYPSLNAVKALYTAHKSCILFTDDEGYRACLNLTYFEGWLKLNRPEIYDRLMNLKLFI